MPLALIIVSNQCLARVVGGLSQWSHQGQHQLENVCSRRGRPHPAPRLGQLLIEHGVCFTSRLSLGLVVAPSLLEVRINLSAMLQIEGNSSIDLFERERREGRYAPYADAVAPRTALSFQRSCPPRMH